MKLTCWLLISLITLIGFSTVAAQASFKPGDKMIFVAPSSPIYTSATSTDTYSGEISRGTPSQVMAVDDTNHRVYLIDHAYGWVDETIGGQPSLVPYDDQTMNQIGTQAQADIAAHPDDKANYVTAALVAYFTGHTSDALNFMNTIIQKDPNDGYLLYQRGGIYLNDSQWNSALDDLQAAVAEKYVIANAYNRIAIALEGMQEYDFALTDYGYAIGATPSWGLLHNNMANSENSLGDTDAALQDYSTAIRLDPLLAMAYRNRGELYQALGNYNAGLDDFNTAIQIEPFEPLGYVKRADFYAEVLQNYDSAFNDYTSALSINPQYAVAYIDRGVTYIESGDVQKGLNDLKQGISIDPNNADGRYNLASIYAYLGDYNGALEQYTQVINLNAAHAYSALLYRPQIDFALGSLYDDALNDLNAYIAGNPGQYFDAVAYIERAVVYVHQGDYARAQADLLSAVSAQSVFTKQYYQYGSGYRVTPKRLQTLADLQAKAAGDTKNAETQFEVAELALEVGQWQIAYNSFKLYGGLTNITDSNFAGFLTMLQQLAS